MADQVTISVDETTNEVTISVEESVSTAEHERIVQEVKDEVDASVVEISNKVDTLENQAQNLNASGELPAANVTRGDSTVDADITALETLPGAGRTTETVKRNYDNQNINWKSFFAGYDSELTWTGYATATDMADPSLSENEVLTPQLGGTFTNLSGVVVPSDFSKYYIKKGSTGYSVESIKFGTKQLSNALASSYITKLDSTLTFIDFLTIADYGPSLDATNGNAWIIAEAGTYGGIDYDVGDIMYRNNAFLKYEKVNIFQDLTALSDRLDIVEVETVENKQAVKGTIAFAQKDHYILNSATDPYSGSDEDADVMLIEAYSVIKKVIAFTGLDDFEKVKLSFVKKATGSCRFIFNAFNGSSWVRIIDTGAGGVDVPTAAEFEYEFYDHPDYYIKAIIDLSALPLNYNGFIESETIEPLYVLKEKQIDVVPYYDSFELFSDDYKTNQIIWGTAVAEPIMSMDEFHKAISFIRIYGGTPSNIYKLRLLARNDTINNWAYRFIISQSSNNGSTWTTFIDTGAGYTVTESGKGITVIDYESGSIRILMHVAFDKIPDNSAPIVWSYWNGQGSDGGSNTPGLIIRRECINGYTGIYDAFDQSLNTTDDVKFNSVEIEGALPSGTLASPPVGITSGDYWLDTTDSATHPILRQMQ